VASSSAFSSKFDPAKFRFAVENAMLMGLPEATSERVTFRWRDKKEYAKQDNRKKPYNWTAAPTEEETHADVLVPAAVEFAQNSRVSAETTVGSFNTPRVTITVLDTHFPDVETADLVLLDDGIYRIEYWGPPIGLFSVTIYQCYAVAYDEA
jgi:hypothetical protein